VKIAVRNFGIIREAEIDLKPLTIFVGPNNMGKTWLAYALAGIFGPYGFSGYLDDYEKEDASTIYPSLQQAIEQVINKGSATIDMYQFAKRFGETYFNNVAQSVQRWMTEYMSTELASFEELSVSINLAETKTDFLEQVSRYSLRAGIVGADEIPRLTISKKRGDKRILVYTSTHYASSDDNPTEEPTSEQLPSEVIKDFLTREVFEIIHRAIYRDVRILPTERTTFIAYPFNIRKIDRRELENQEQKSQQKMKKILEPVGNFLGMMQSTFEDESAERARREKDAKSNPKIKEFIDLAQLLEDQVLGGKVDFAPPESSFSQGASRSELYPTPEILFHPTPDSKLELSIASSMVKELSPLLFYLRYLARPRELLVIDEPEMNLHPEAQAKMIEFLAILINAGLNILITTHSPYVIDHLTNLIKAYEAEDKERILSEFYLKRTDTFVSKDKVSVYLFDRGQARQVMDEEGVIDLDTFGQVSDHISEIYFKL